VSRRHSRRRCPFGYESCEDCPYLRTNQFLTSMLALLVTGAIGPAREGTTDHRLIEELLAKLLGIKQPGPAAPEPAGGADTSGDKQEA